MTTNGERVCHDWTAACAASGPILTASRDATLSEYWTDYDSLGNVDNDIKVIEDIGTAAATLVGFAGPSLSHITAFLRLTHVRHFFVLRTLHVIYTHVSALLQLYGSAAADGALVVNSGPVAI